MATFCRQLRGGVASGVDGKTDAERRGALDDVHQTPKTKCPFVPQREMVKKLRGNDADPLANKGEWEKRLAKVGKQSQFQHCTCGRSGDNAGKTPRAHEPRIP